MLCFLWRCTHGRGSDRTSPGPMSHTDHSSRTLGPRHQGHIADGRRCRLHPGPTFGTLPGHCNTHRFRNLPDLLPGTRCQDRRRFRLVGTAHLRCPSLTTDRTCKSRCRGSCSRCHQRRIRSGIRGPRRSRRRCGSWQRSRPPDNSFPRRIAGPMCRSSGIGLPHRETRHTESERPPGSTAPAHRKILVACTHSACSSRPHRSSPVRTSCMCRTRHMTRRHRRCSRQTSRIRSADPHPLERDRRYHREARCAPWRTPGICRCKRLRSTLRPRKHRNRTGPGRRSLPRRPAHVVPRA
jgi:hypothetical protein